MIGEPLVRPSSNVSRRVARDRTYRCVLRSAGDPAAGAGSRVRPRLDELGYGAVWTGEGLGTREMFSNAAVILGGTSRIAFCAGIANIWGRDPVTAVTATRTLLESFPGRFLLGLGVSHREQVEPRGYAYERPLARMRAYLDA